MNFTRWLTLRSCLNSFSQSVIAFSLFSLTLLWGYLLLMILQILRIIWFFRSPQPPNYQFFMQLAKDSYCSILPNSSVIFFSTWWSSFLIFSMILGSYISIWLEYRMMVLIPEIMYLFIISLRVIFCMRSNSPSKSFWQFFPPSILLMIATMRPSKASWHLRQGIDTIYLLWILRQDFLTSLQGERKFQLGRTDDRFAVWVLFSGGSSGVRGGFGRICVCFFRVSSSGGGFGEQSTGVVGSICMSVQEEIFCVNCAELRVKRLGRAYGLLAGGTSLLGVEMLSFSPFSLSSYYLWWSGWLWPGVAACGETSRLLSGAFSSFLSETRSLRELLRVIKSSIFSAVDAIQYYKIIFD